MIYVISDLHGCPVNKLVKLLNKADFNDNDTLYVLGDIIDRGFFGVELLFFLSEHKNIQPIMGNHEFMLLMCEQIIFNDNQVSESQRMIFREWQYNGGIPTIDSLKKLSFADKEKVFSYIKSFPYYVETKIKEKSYVLCHSGISNFSPEKPLSEYNPEDFLWNRPKMNQEYYPDKNKKVIFGHTQTFLLGKGERAGKIYKTDSWIDIDVGLNHPPLLLRLDDMKTFTE